MLIAQFDGNVEREGGGGLSSLDRDSNFEDGERESIVIEVP